jgi:ATP-binding cassette subfamily B protein
MIVVAFFEVISIGAVLPFLGVLTAPAKVFEHPIARPLIQLLDLTQADQLLKPLTILFGITAIVSGGLRLLLTWVQTRLSFAMGSDFSSIIYRRTLYQPYAIHLSRNTSEVISGVSTKADGIIHQTILPILMISSSGMMILTVMLVFLSIQPVVAFLAIGGFGSIYSIVIKATRKQLTANSQLVSRQHSRIIKVLQEALGGIRDVLIDGTQNIYCDIFRDADWRLRRAQSNINIVAISPRYIVEALGMAMIALLAYQLAVRPDGLASAIPIMGALALAAQRMLPLLQQAYSNWTNMRGGQSGLCDALDFLDQPLPEYANEPPPKPLPFSKEISLSGLGFRYGDQLPWVVKDLSLQIPRGSRIGFIGTTGSGKSTLLDIIMGLLSPSEGEMLIDGQPISDTNCRSWQAHISHVPQSIFLADASIAENIAFGIQSDLIDISRVRHAAERAQIANTVASWKLGYDTVVGERGVRLSGGQRQRIGIARALYKAADVIVFDEATSALDGDTEHAVMESIKQLSDELTILIVAHRLSTLRDCTHVVELAKGSIKRVGSFQEIIGSTQQI